MRIFNTTKDYCSGKHDCFYLVHNISNFWSLNIDEKKAIAVEKTNLSESLAKESLKNQTLTEEYDLIKEELKRLKENCDKLESKPVHNSI